MTNPGCQRFEGLCTLVAAGAATHEEQDVFKNHLEEGCLACNEAHKEFFEINADWVNQLTPLPPSPLVRERLLTAMTQEAEIIPQKAKGFDLARGVGRSRYKERATWPTIHWPWAIGWAFAALFGILLFSNIQKDRQATQKMEAQLQSLHLAVAEKEAALHLIKTRQTQVVTLGGLAPSPNAAAKVFWNAQANTGLLITFDLPLLPLGKVYQLWAIQDAGPFDAGIFSPDPEGTSTLKIKSIPDPQQPVGLFAITIESEGGSPQPTGEMVLKGTI